MTINNSTPPLDELGLKHAAALQALIECSGNVAAAAKISNVSKTTIHRWLKNDAHFAAALHEARLSALQMATSKLAMGSSAAVDTLITIANSTKVAYSVRVQAAQAILAHASRYIEQVDIAVRLAALEGKNGNH